MKWTLDNQRKSIIEDQHQYKCISAGRRWGKTHLALLWLLDGYIEPNQRRWYVCPTYRQGKTIVMPMLRDIARNTLGCTINESELTIRFANGAEVAIKGAENEDNLRGVGLSKVVLDEFAFMKPHVWQEIILPMLSDTKGQAFFIGTPDGINHFYDVFLRGLGDDPDWKSWQFKTIDGGFVDKNILESNKKNMDERTWKQEFEASFETAQNRCAYNFNRETHCKKAEVITEKKFWGCDFNVGAMSAVLCCEYSDSVLHYYEEIRLVNSNTEELAREMRNIQPNIPVYPDPAGQARSTTSSKSDHTILRDFGFRIVARRSHSPHRDRLNALNRKLKNAEGMIGMTVDPKLKFLIKDLEMCQRDKHGGIDKSNPELTHFLDACSYLIDYRFPVTRRMATSINW
tara:strand:+ start:472 stop:1674 length:1203 start_codon:yes stop_codon:yes gene_type:complete